MSRLRAASMFLPLSAAYSTYRRAALGGFHGRALQAGDDLPLGLSDASARDALSLAVSLSAPDVLRVMRGPNAEYFKPSAFETLLSTAYTIAPASDRMGLRLQGAALEHAIEGELPSQGTTSGGWQVPSDGQPICFWPTGRRPAAIPASPQ